MPTWRAPGRVNLIGEHTDYNLGLVLPMAIGLDCRVTTRPNKNDYLHVVSRQLSEERTWPLADIPDLQPVGDWGDHIVGVAWEFYRRGRSVAPLDLEIDSEIPIGGGLSSSAAVGVSVALALAGEKIDSLELAKLCRAAETDFVGIPCGIMDQFASAHGGIVLLDCRSLESRAVQLPEGLAVVAVNSMVKHELGESAYKTRVEECSEAARQMGVASLRDARIEQVNQLGGTIKRRARHVVTENERVEAFAATQAPERLGQVLIDSHRSLRDDYEVSCEELDFLVDAAIGIEGVFGARMTGGGFGGCTVNLMRAEARARFEEKIRSAYSDRFGIVPAIYRCEPAPGAGEIR
jgi:galactokinase